MPESSRGLWPRVVEEGAGGGGVEGLRYGGLSILFCLSKYVHLNGSAIDLALGRK